MSAGEWRKRGHPSRSKKREAKSKPGQTLRKDREDPGMLSSPMIGVIETIQSKTRGGIRNETEMR